MIAKQKFVDAIESIRLQLAEDKKNAQIAGEIFQSEHFNLYDNSKLICTILDLLRVYFPKDREGFCYLEHFAFDCDFGKIGNIENADELYDRLSANYERHV